MSRQQGIVKFWNEERGFGFLEAGEYPHDFDLFFHISSCEDYEPSKGDIVTFRKNCDKNGKASAICIVPTGEADPSHFDNRVSRRRYDEARKTSLRYERGCTCKEDLEKCEESFDLPGGRCWYCNEMYD